MTALISHVHTSQSQGVVRLMVCIQGVVAVSAPFLYTFGDTAQALKADRTQVVQQSVMQTFIGSIWRKECALHVQQQS